MVNRTASHQETKSSILATVAGLSILGLLLFAHIAHSASNHPIMAPAAAPSGTEASIANVSSVTRFAKSQKELRLNGVVHYGTISSKDAAIIDRYDDANFFVVVRLPQTAGTFSEARSACKALGEGWDLPTFNRRAQLATLNGDFAPSQGAFEDTLGRQNNLFAFWLRFQNEADNKIAFDNVDETAFVLSYPSADRNFIANKEPKISRLNVAGKYFLDGFMYMVEKAYNQERGFLLNLQGSKTPLLGFMEQVIMSYFEPGDARYRIPATALQPVAEYFEAHPNELNRVSRMVRSQSTNAVRMALLPRKIRAQVAAKGTLKSLSAETSKRIFQILEVAGVEAFRRAVPKAPLNAEQKKEFKEAEVRAFHAKLRELLSYEFPLDERELNQLWAAHFRHKLNAIDTVADVADIYFPLQRSRGSAFPVLCASEQFPKAQ